MILSCSLNQLYKSVGISKQGVYDMLKRSDVKHEIEAQLVFMIEKIRLDHPTMGAREMYYKLRPDGIGRDAFEELCMNNNFRVIKSKNYRKTTDSQGVKRFCNLLDELEVRWMNQVWVSDITYYEISGRFYFITLIQDAFTRVIVGYNSSKRLTTEQTTLPALEKAIKSNRAYDLEGLIFHSDGGGQYYARTFLKLTKKMKLVNSMGKTCYENAMAESLNGVIKRKYLDHWDIKSFGELQRQLDRVVKLYNTDKPHSSLNRLTPKEYEKRYLNLGQQTRAKMTKSIDAKYREDMASSHIVSKQTKAPNLNITSANEVKV